MAAKWGWRNPRAAHVTDPVLRQVFQSLERHLIDRHVEAAEVADVAESAIQPGPLDPSDSLESDNYTPALPDTAGTGWRIDGDGNAWFNDVQVAGTLVTGTAEDGVVIERVGGVDAVKLVRPADFVGSYEPASFARASSGSFDGVALNGVGRGGGSDRPFIWMLTSNVGGGAQTLLNGNVSTGNGSFITNGVDVARPPLYVADSTLTQNLGTNVWTDVQFTTSAVVNNQFTDGFTSTSTLTKAGDNRTFTVNRSGYYQVSVNHRWTVNSAGARQVRIFQNGSLDRYLGGVGFGGGLLTQVHQSTDMRVFPFVQGDTFKVQLNQDSGGALDKLFCQLSFKYLSD